MREGVTILGGSLLVALKLQSTNARGVGGMGGGTIFGCSHWSGLFRMMVFGGAKKKWI